MTSLYFYISISVSLFYVNIVTLSVMKNEILENWTLWLFYAGGVIVLLCPLLFLLVRGDKWKCKITFRILCIGLALFSIGFLPNRVAYLKTLTHLRELQAVKK